MLIGIHSLAHPLSRLSDDDRGFSFISENIDMQAQVCCGLGYQPQ